MSLEMLPERGRDLILAGALLSILLNPLFFAALDWMLARRGERDAAAPKAAAKPGHIPRRRSRI